MALFAEFGIGIVFLFIFMVLLGGLFMWLAAKIARVEDASFGRAAAAAIGSGFVSVLAAFIFNMLPVFGNLFGFIIGLILSLFVIKLVFRATLGKALAVWICNLVATVVALALAAMLTASALFVGRGI